jgi:carboxyl-terminal processing protease
LVTAPAYAEAGFDPQLAADVFSTAFKFIVPRGLDKHSAEQLALWGLNSISTRDPSFRISEKSGVLVLESVTASANAPPIMTEEPIPDPDDFARWGRFAANMLAAAAESSPSLQKLPAAALTQGFFDEIFAHFDSYSRYVPPQPAEEARGRLAIEGSAGAKLVLAHGQVLVGDIVPGGPGEAADLRIGDRVLAIGGMAVTSHKIDLAQEALTGDDGEEVIVKVRGRDGMVRLVHVVLAPVPPETVFTDQRDRILSIVITSFTANTAERLSHALETGLLAHPKAVIVDLRGNRGGLVRQAVTSVALFAESGVVASTSGRAPEAAHIWRIEGGDLTEGLPVIILVDGRTASAAEIMAAALADLGRAVVVGSSTLGKGLVQTLTRLPDGGELFLTWSRVLAPAGWPLQSLGVIPQICTSTGDVALNHTLDALAAGNFHLSPAVLEARRQPVPAPANKAAELRAACPSADGGDLDVTAAKFLADHPDAYRAAILPPVRKPQ